MHFKCVHTYVFSLHESEKIKYLHTRQYYYTYVEYLQSHQLQAGHAIAQPSPSVLLLSSPSVLICGWTASPFCPPIILSFCPHMWQDSPPSFHLLVSCSAVRQCDRRAFTSYPPVILSSYVAGQASSCHFLTPYSAVLTSSRTGFTFQPLDFQSFFFVLIFGQNSLPLPTSCPPLLLSSCVGRTAFTFPLPVLLSLHRRKGQPLTPHLLSS